MIDAADDLEFGKLDFDELDKVLIQEENHSIDKNATTIEGILGLGVSKKLPPSIQALDHYEVDIDMYDEIYTNSSVIQNSVAEGMKELPVFDNLNKDMFLSLFKYQPTILPESRMKRSTVVNNRVMRVLVETPEYKSLRRHCRLDLFNSALGTEILSSKAVEIIKNWKEEALEKYKQRQQAKQAQQGQPGNGGTPGGGGGIGAGGFNQPDPNQVQNPFEVMEQLKAAEQQLDDLLAEQQNIQQLLDQMQSQGGGGPVPAPLQSAMDQNALDLATAQAVAQAKSDQLDDFLAPENDDLMEDLAEALTGAFSEADCQVAEMSDMLDAWGIGADGNSGTVRVPFAEKREAVDRIRDTPKLKKLTDLIGRMKETAIHDQKKKSPDGATSVKSIHTGNNIASVLPSEKLRLCNDVTKGDFYQRYDQKQLLQYDKESTKVKAKGPIIALCDTSGSMNSTREKWSKAVMIAMLEIAHLQKRDFAGIIFSDDADEPIVITKDMVEPAKLLDLAENFHGGGTDFEAPLNKALELIKDSKFKKADIVLITDGECAVSPSFLKKFNQVKEEKEFVVKGVCINAGSGRVSTRSLDSFCDDVICLSSVADLEKADSEAAHNIFSNL